MVTVQIEKRYGAATVRSSITARSIELALEIAGPGAEVLFPLDPETFFTHDDTVEAGEHIGELTDAFAWVAA